MFGTTWARAMLAKAHKAGKMIPKTALRENRCIMTHGGDACGDGKCIVTGEDLPLRMKELIFKIA